MDEHGKGRRRNFAAGIFSSFSSGSNIVSPFAISKNTIIVFLSSNIHWNVIWRPKPCFLQAVFLLKMDYVKKTIKKSIKYQQFFRCVSFSIMLAHNEIIILLLSFIDFGFFTLAWYFICCFITDESWILQKNYPTNSPGFARISILLSYSTLLCRK